MKERPIIFSGPMVQALLDRRKTQTRRVVKPQHIKLLSDGVAMPRDFPTIGSFTPRGGAIEARMANFNAILGIAACPFGRVGDKLWAREAWKRNRYANNWQDVCIEYASGGEFWNKDPSAPKTVPEIKWRSPIHMPRWASRITLEITSIRVERVQAISEEDAKAEGIIEWRARKDSKRHYGLTVADVWEGTACEAFMRLWNSINGKTYPWSSNCWVWVVGFEVVPA